MKINLKLLAIIGAMSLVVTGCNEETSNSISISGSTNTSNSISASTSTTTKINLKTGERREIAGANVQVLSGNDSVVIEQGTLSAYVYAIMPGNVVLNNGSETFELSISFDVYEISNGSSYLFWQDSKNSYRGSKDEPFMVGTKNEVKLDVELMYLTWVLQDSEYITDLVQVSLYDVIEYFDYDVEYSFNFKETELNLSELVEINDNKSISFKDSAIGKEVDVNFKTSFSNNSITQSFMINDGYNAYDNDSFKTLFQNRDIAKINVLRNFKATLDEEQYYFNTYYNKKVPFNTTNASQEIHYQGSVYFRYGGSSYGDLTPLEINGNYMQIDGSELPEHIPFIKSQEGSYADMPEGFANTQSGAIGGTESFTNPIVNVHAGIFRISQINELTANDETKISFKNLSVLGASVNDGTDNPTVKSGGFIGAFIDGVKVDFENCNLQYLTFGMQINYLHGDAKIKDTKISDTWGPALTTWMAKSLNVENSYLNRTGGPTINIINVYGRTEGQNGSIKTNLVVDNKTEMQNYMVTDSEWFNAYHLDIGTQATAIEQIMNNAGYSIYNSGTKQMNFVGLFQPGSDYSTYPLGANVKIGNQETEINPIQYTDTSGKYATFNPYGNALFTQNNALILAFGQVIDASIATASNPLVAYVTQIATKLGTYHMSGEQHLYIEIDVNIFGQLLAAVLEVTPMK